MFHFRLPYFLLTILLLLFEIAIALYVRDAFVRPYLGDFLVVILVYCFVRAFFKASVKAAAWGTLAFALAVEALQYANIVQRLGLQRNGVASVVIGSSAEWADLLAYALGIGFVFLIESRRRRTSVP